MTINSKRTLIGTLIASGLLVIAVPFEDMKFNQEVNVNAINAVNESIGSSNGVVVITDRKNSVPQDKVNGVNGIQFDIYEQGELKLFFSNEDDTREPMRRIFVNGSTLQDKITTVVDGRIEEVIDGKITTVVDDKISKRDNGVVFTASSNVVQQMVYNPLWGKKLAVIGDSLTCSPSKQTSWGAFIAQRNNMTFVNNGRGGEKLCDDRITVTTNTPPTITTNIETGVVLVDDSTLVTTTNITNMSTIKSYTNDIPVDADFILCQIGANDSSDRWSTRPGEDDTDMTLDTFKGCWNNLLFGLKKNYPNAKIGMILANNWKTNVGSNSNDVINYGARRQMTQWQKAQCHRLNIPVLDPVEDTRMFIYNYKSYPTNNNTITSTSIPEEELDWFDKMKQQMGTSNLWFKENVHGWVSQTQYMKDTQHTTEMGNKLLSFFYENWMKTVLMCN